MCRVQGLSSWDYIGLYRDSIGLSMGYREIMETEMETTI